MAYLGTKPANQVIDSTLIADGVITTADLANGAITDAKIAAMAASKLTGQVPRANAPSGSVLQVVSATKTDTFSRQSSVGDFGDITGLSVSITPLSTSSKILILVNVNGTSSPGQRCGIRLVRNSTAIGIADSASNRIRASSSYGGGYDSSHNSFYAFYASLLDSPNTTSSTTYKVQCSAEGTQTFFVNRSSLDSDATDIGRGTSTITVMEIAG
jgi:hypothetical protein